MQTNNTAQSDDLLDMDYINSLPQPFMTRVSGTWWPVHDLEVQTGLMRIDVCGKLDVLNVCDVSIFRDMDGKEHCSDDFYLDSERTQLANVAGKESA